MNCEICHLKELELEIFQVREVLRCILHTILFHRALGLVRPKDVDSEHFEITYVQCGDAELEKKIEEKVDHFCSWAEKHPNKKGQVLLSFYEVKNRQASWFTNKVERLYWEQWHVNLHVLQPSAARGKPHSSRSSSRDSAVAGEGDEGGSRRRSLEASLREVLFQIVRFVNEKKDHVPNPNPDSISFPFEIAIPSHSDSSFGVEIFKRMLQTGHPTMLS
ncbi:meiotically up-regulated protein [Wolffia australiana]